MICKNCNAEIDDNSVQCPFCGTPTTMDVDPNAAPVNTIPQPAEQPAQDFSQPNYGQPTPPPVTPMVDPSQYEPNAGGPDIEKEAGTVWTLGLVGLIVSIVIGFCCCALPGPIVGIVGLVKAKKLDGSVGLLSAESQNKLKNGKIMCYVAIGLGVAGILANILLSVTGTLANIMENNS